MQKIITEKAIETFNKKAINYKPKANKDIQTLISLTLAMLTVFLVAVWCMYKLTN